MKRYKKETRYTSVLTVHVPSAEALIDMLRYDRCVPLDEDESRKIMRLITDWRVDGAHEPEPANHVVRLLRLAASDGRATEGRWASFGCRVLDERNPDDVQLTDEEILSLAEVAR